jgi:hypothetical protein
LANFNKAQLEPMCLSYFRIHYLINFVIRTSVNIQDRCIGEVEIAGNLATHSKRKYGKGMDGQNMM